ncbi:hypothetical protein HDU96_000508 [Phlyctochytrium bullatum]|nr:hypothetical protein HDU96_000508 [Phlyctochytrium bullatum]
MHASAAHQRPSFSAHRPTAPTQRPPALDPQSYSALSPHSVMTAAAAIQFQAALAQQQQQQGYAPPQRFPRRHSAADTFATQPHHHQQRHAPWDPTAGDLAGVPRDVLAAMLHSQAVNEASKPPRGPQAIPVPRPHPQPPTPTSASYPDMYYPPPPTGFQTIAQQQQLTAAMSQAAAAAAAATAFAAQQQHGQVVDAATLMALGLQQAALNAAAGGGAVAAAAALAQQQQQQQALQQRPGTSSKQHRRRALSSDATLGMVAVQPTTTGSPTSSTASSPGAPRAPGPAVVIPPMAYPGFPTSAAAPVVVPGGGGPLSPKPRSARKSSGNIHATSPPREAEEGPSKEPGAKKVDKEQKKVNLYKTELCRSWEETGDCRYGAKCQFAHSMEELRVVERHPKYKTQMCKTFWEKGTCPYGKRCCFIHTTSTLNAAAAAAAAAAAGGTSTTTTTPTPSITTSLSPPTDPQPKSALLSPVGIPVSLDDGLMFGDPEMVFGPVSAPPTVGGGTHFFEPPSPAAPPSASTARRVSVDRSLPPPALGGEAYLHAVPEEEDVPGSVVAAFEKMGVSKPSRPRNLPRLNGVDVPVPNAPTPQDPTPFVGTPYPFSPPAGGHQRAASGPGVPAAAAPGDYFEFVPGEFAEGFGGGNGRRARSVTQPPGGAGVRMYGSLPRDPAATVAPPVSPTVGPAFAAFGAEAFARRPSAAAAPAAAANGFLAVGSPPRAGPGSPGKAGEQRRPSAGVIGSGKAPGAAVGAVGAGPVVASAAEKEFESHLMAFRQMN